MGGMKESYYPDTAGHRGIDTSIEAAKSIDANKLRGLSLDIIKSSMGLNSFEVYQIINKNFAIAFHDIQPRISELVATGQIKDSKIRRPGRTSKKAIVYVAVPVDQIKPPAIKIKPIGEPTLFGEMMRATMAYAKDPHRLNHQDMMIANRKWLEALAGSMGNITYTIEGEK